MRSSICNGLRLGTFLRLALFIFGTTGIGSAPSAEANRLIVDDFEKPGKKNLRGGDFGAFGDPDGRGQCYLFFSQNKDTPQKGNNKYALYIQ